MNISSFVTPLVGGALIGTSASLFLLTHGRVAGISGLVGGLFESYLLGRSAKPSGPPQLRAPRGSSRAGASFLAGLLLAGVAGRVVFPSAFEASHASWLVVLMAGIFVGVGTQLGSGCTSGHGVCGISRFSVRSIVATITFIAAGMATVFFVGRS